MSLARVACVIPARDVADRIQATVIAARALPGVDVVIVTDDGSSDPTGDYAAASGAIVVTHQRGRGRAAAIESGVNALGVLEQRDKRPGVRHRPGAGRGPGCLGRAGPAPHRARWSPSAPT